MSRAREQKTAWEKDSGGRQQGWPTAIGANTETFVVHANGILYMLERGGIMPSNQRGTINSTHYRVGQLVSEEDSCILT